MKTRNKIGSNQHRTKQRFLKGKTYLSILFVMVLFSPAVFVSYQAKASEVPVIISPIAMDSTYTVEVIRPSEAPLANLSERENSIRIIKKIWGRDWKIGVAIATCESGLNSKAFNPNNSNGSTDTGLFQINSVHGWSKEELLNPIANAGIAYEKFVHQGTNPWYSSAKCWGVKI